MIKRVLIALPTLRNGGGVIRGLQNMLSLMPKDKYRISVLPMGYSDDNIVELINCEVLPYNFILTAITAIYSQTKGYKYRFLLKIAKVVLTILSKIKKRYKFENYLFSKVAQQYNGYDVVIAYEEGLCTRFVQYIDSSYRIAWIHCDYSEYRKSCLISEEEIYNKYQQIVCVSGYTLQKFQQIYPLLKGRSSYIHNLLDKTFIREVAEDFFPVEFKNNNEIKIVSIGRLHPVKQFHLIPTIISQILAMGVTNFKWVLIGGGDSKEYDKILSEIRRLNISDKFFTYLGAKFNPYPYIKNSDILVSTSLSEACPFVVNEARVLGVPVVSNNYPSIYEFIENGINGRISSIGQLASDLSGLITNANKLEKLKRGAKERDYNNDKIISGIISLIDNETIN